VLNQISGLSNAFYWTAGSTTAIACDAPTGGGIATDIGVSDVFPTTCPDYVGATMPTTVQDFQGPIQAMNFVVPIGATPNVMTHDAAYFLFGFNATSTVGPWTNPAQIFVRGTGSGTENMLATAIDVPSPKWPSTFTTETSTQNLIAALQVQTGDTALGIAASTDFDTTQTVTLNDAGTSESPRTVLKLLAYQHKGQTCAYYPDSSSTSFDKRNVRDGHYAVWGPLHFVTSEYSSNSTVKYIIQAIQGATGDASSDAVLTASIGAHTIPQCAMSVSRSAEMGAISPYKPTNACTCYFELTATGTLPSGCKACSSDTDCAGNTGATHCSVYAHVSASGDAGVPDGGVDAGTINEGYCEAQ
jgi:hypothetical protein